MSKMQEQYEKALNDQKFYYESKLSYFQELKQPLVASSLTSSTQC